MFFRESIRFAPDLVHYEPGRLQRMRDNPQCADQEYDRILDDDDKGLFCDLTFEFDSTPTVIEQPPSQRMLF